MTYNGIEPLQPSPHEESMNNEESLNDDTFSSLNKQNTIFSLTLEEIQCKSGKCFGSMNMDEFLDSVWSVEENQVSSQSIQNEPSNDRNINMQPPTLSRQGSFSIPIPLCKKTVDEVWYDIQKDQPQHQKLNNISDEEPPQRQRTFGEMTLEDFLIKAGVIQEATRSSAEQKMITQPSVQNNNTCLNTNFGMGHGVMGQGFPSHQIMSNNLAGNGYAPYSIFSQSKTFVGESSNNSGENEKGIDLREQKIKKRIIDGPPEVVVERRQRRMIKNRESAARSRARKQAYTVELEHELNQLKEENEKLKQLVEEIEENRKHELVMKKKQSTVAQKKAEKLRTTRRTVSWTW